MTDITYAPIIPLIGGEALGVMEHLNGKLPEYILTYPAFAKNDAHYINYLRTKKGWTGEVHLIDPLTNKLFNDVALPTVDLMCAVPPCAGLSSLNGKSGGGCPANDWMYLSTRFALENIKPKVLFGENAPRLGTESGKMVRDGIYKIARDNGYSLAIYKTSSVKHGLCQKRPRTFYFLFQGDQVPHIEYFERVVTPFLKQIGPGLDKDDPMAISTGIFENPPSEYPFYKYILEVLHKCSHQEFVAGLDDDAPILDYLNRKAGGFTGFIQWAGENGFDHAKKRATGIQMKLDDSKGYWGHGLVAVPADGISPSYVSNVPYGCMHPLEDRYITLREGLRLMGMPEDFEVLGGAKNTNHVCQNVPVTTAIDMAAQACKFINNELPLIDSNYVIFDNNTKKAPKTQVSDENLLAQFFT